jgi:hypothetical protein
MINRINAINLLIKTISEGDRHFFLNKDRNGMVANFSLEKGKLFYQDEWKGKIIEIKENTQSEKLVQWVSHGSALRSQIIEFARYIFTGEHGKLLSRYWGESFESQIKIHQKAREVGYYEQAGFVIHDYTANMDRYCCDECGIAEAYSKCEKGTYLCSQCASVHYHLTSHIVMPLR